MTQQQEPDTSSAPDLPGGTAQQAAQQRRNGFGTTALCLSLTGIVLALIPLLGVIAVLLGILAIIFGALGVGRTARGAATNRKMSFAGTGLGVVAVALGIVGILLFAHAADAFVAGFNNALRRQGTTTEQGSDGRIPAPYVPAAPAEPGSSYSPPTSSAPFAAVNYTYEVTGNYPARFFSYTDSNGDSVATYQLPNDDAPHELPWRKTVEPEPNGGLNSLGAATSSNRGNAWITCTLKDDQGRVIDSDTARGAYAQCYASSLGY